MDELAAGVPGRRSGSAAALVAGVAAALVAMTARTGDGWEDAAGVAAQAETLRARLMSLANENAHAFAAAQDALDATRAGEGSAGDAGLGQAMAYAAEVPLAIAESSCDVAQAACLVAELGHPEVQADAAAAAALAAGAASAAAHLVAVNLGATREDKRVRRAETASEAAAEAATRALARV
jgi:formiminotetrahydrofolate cyclodeaminase